MSYEDRINKLKEDANDIVNDIIIMKENPEYLFPSCQSSWKFPDVGRNFITMLKLMIESKLFLDYGIVSSCQSTRRIRSTGEIEFKVVVNADWTDIVPLEGRSYLLVHQ
jgi:hypothetical protein